MLDYSFEKAKLPKNTSYPLKRSTLDLAIQAAAIEKLQWVRYARQHPNGHVVLRAYRFGDSSKGKGAGLSTIIVYAVASRDRKHTEEMILGEGLGKLLAWIRSIELSGNTRSGSDQFFLAESVEGTLRYSFA